jgi:hypothetical protein
MRAPGGESHYEVLGVPRTATQEQIRFAYRSLAAHYHPDKHVGNPLQELAAEKLARINEAHEVLGDPQRRASYDAALGLAGGARAGGRRRWPSLPVIAIGLVLGVLLLRPLLALTARLVRMAAGTPAGLVLAVVALTGGLAWWLRRRHRR